MGLLFLQNTQVNSHLFHAADSRAAGGRLSVCLLGCSCSNSTRRSFNSSSSLSPSRNSENLQSTPEGFFIPENIPSGMMIEIGILIPFDRRGFPRPTS
jgi:hypothetical protein